MSCLLVYRFFQDIKYTSVYRRAPGDRVSYGARPGWHILCSLVYPYTQAPPTSASQALGLQVYTTHLGVSHFILTRQHNLLMIKIQGLIWCLRQGSISNFQPWPIVEAYGQKHIKNVRVKASPEPLAFIYPKSLECSAPLQAPSPISLTKYCPLP